jgi:hypothetical protein
MMMKRIILFLIITVTMTTCDNIPFLDYLEYEVDYYQTREALDEAIWEAEDLLANAVEGFSPGEYHPYAMTNINNALSYGQQVSADEDASIEELHWALSDLENVIDVFPSWRILPLDILFVTDINGSMGPYLSNIKVGISDIINAVQTNLYDVHYGAVSFRDYDHSGYGVAGDLEFILDRYLSTDTATLISIINNYSASGGADIENSLLEALFRSADTGEIGWRYDTDRIILVFTINEGHNSDVDTLYPGHGMSETINALNQENIRVLSFLITAASTAAVNQNAYIAEATNGIMTSNVSDILSAANQSLNALAPYYFYY